MYVCIYMNVYIYEEEDVLARLEQSRWVPRRVI